MARQTTTPHETILRDTFRKMDGDQYQAIRDAYYKAVEGLQALADALEVAGETSDDYMNTSDCLMAEHLLAANAIQTMNKSVLGRIL